MVAAVLAASNAAAQPRTTLPLEKVRLYEVGVGYFERSGRLNGGGSVELPVPASHLDDALKTLVVLRKDGPVTVSGVQFASTVSRSLGRALAGLPTDSETPFAFTEILRSLKGVRVELRSESGLLRGRIADVLSAEQSDLMECQATVPAPRDGGNAQVEPRGNAQGSTGRGSTSRSSTAPGSVACVQEPLPALVIAGDSGELRRFAIRDVIGIRPLDAALKQRFDAAVGALSHSSVREHRPLEIMTKAGGALRIGYLAETAVWRTSYRLVIQGQESRLQGWALLHNDSDEDWRGIKLELVNGQPDSYLFPLAAPRYNRRRMVTPDTELPTVPQLLERSPDELWGDSEENLMYGGLGLSGIGEGGGGRGEGIGLGSVGAMGAGAAASRGAKKESSEITVGDLAALAPSEGTESPAQFRYALASALDLRARSSALVPFVEIPVEIRRIDWFDGPDVPARSSLHIKNPSQQTLPTGTLAVFADGGFAGETSLDRLKPQQAQILDYGADLDVILEKRGHATRERGQKIHYESGTLVEHYLLQHDFDYHLTNRSGTARSVYIGLVLANNAKITGSDQMGFDSARKQAYAVFEIQKNSERDLRFRAEEGLERQFSGSNLNTATLRRLAQGAELSVKHKDSLQRAAENLAQAEQSAKAKARAAERLIDAEQDLARLRENLRALQGPQHSEEEAAAMAHRMELAEQRVSALNHERRLQAAHVRLHKARVRLALQGLGR